MAKHFQIAAPVHKADVTDNVVRLYGWAAMSRDDIGRPVVDSDGEHIPIDELERAAQKAFLRRGGRGAVGVMHSAFARAHLVESFVLSAEKRKAFELGSGPEGWMVGVESEDQEVIDLVRKGQTLELSIRGQARVNSTPQGAVKSAKDAFGEGNYPSGSVGVMHDLELADLELLSIVDRGASANDRVRSRIVLVKSRKPYKIRGKTMSTKARSAQVIVADMLEQGMLADLPPEDKEALLAAVSGGMPAQEPAEVMSESKEGDPEEEKAEDEEMEPKTADMEKLTKRADELSSENVSLKKRLAALEKASVKREIEAVVKSEMAYVPGSSIEQLVKIVAEARENLSKEDATQLEATLKAASACVQRSELLGTAGFHRDGTGNSDPNSQLRALAKSIKEKDQSLSMADALVQAGRQRPDLWRARSASPRA